MGLLLNSCPSSCPQQEQTGPELDWGLCLLAALVLVLSLECPVLVRIIWFSSSYFY